MNAHGFLLLTIDADSYTRTSFLYTKRQGKKFAGGGRASDILSVLAVWAHRLLAPRATLTRFRAEKRGTRITPAAGLTG